MKKKVQLLLFLLGCALLVTISLHAGRKANSNCSKCIYGVNIHHSCN